VNVLPEVRVRLGACLARQLRDHALCDEVISDVHPADLAAIVLC